MVTTGTLSSATLMAQKLPARAFHQFYPLDCPAWVSRFLDHWKPDMALWMESELWPNMLSEIGRRNIPAALVNARMSDKSFKNWTTLRALVSPLLSSFSAILTQTDRDKARFESLGAKNVTTTDNIKFSATPLPCDEDHLSVLKTAVVDRPIWLFASTHKGEEEMACRIHDVLKSNLPDVLTIIGPRHPERRAEILENCKSYGLNMRLRGTEKTPPHADTDIYIADTLGELGLFYTLSPVACIGRSFSDDGGGGHNPIEAAQLDCAVLYGPNVQYQKEIYEEMDAAGAAKMMVDEHRMADTIHSFLTDADKLAAQQSVGRVYADRKSAVIERVITALEPVLKRGKLL
jgi:3-deoxy-D-manno-octulosonic-acid transferase